jgi:FkbM family methyltransferase
MELNTHNEIYKKCKSKNIPIEHVCEVGVYLPETSNVLEFILDGVRTTLVEPDPKNILAINKFFKKNNNITLHSIAIFDYNGVIELSQREASTFVSSLESSPALVNDNYVNNNADNFEVECKTFDSIDDGSIDLLSIDTEGCEWYVIKNMISRPKIISIETHGKAYINPFIKEITGWMKMNDYVLWFKDSSDSIYVIKDLFQISSSDQFNLGWINLTLSLNRLKYKIKKMFVN